MAIPVIDFSKLNGEERAKTLAEIANGCEEWGFFQLVNHGISEELLEKVKRISTEWFKKEREAKFKESTAMKLLSEAQNNNGQKLEHADWEDVFTLMDDTSLWPSNTPGFKETMSEYRSELRALAERVMEAMDENLGLPQGYIKTAFNGGGGGDDGEKQAFFGTKVSHYPPCPQPEHVNGLRAHTDAGGVILLFQDDKVGGLQILKDGHWIDVQPLPNAIVINTGDQIEVLSNGRYKSVWHRVLVDGSGGTRRSIASFYNPSLKATIAPAPQLLDRPENPPAYPEFVFGDYMNVYADQKFLAKEPRFQAVRAIESI